MKLKILLLILTFFYIFQAETFTFTTQAGFEQQMQIIRDHPDRLTWKSLTIDGYDGAWHRDIVDLTEITAIADLTQVENLVIETGNPTYQLTNIDKVTPILANNPSITRLRLHYGNNDITNVCSVFLPIQYMVNLNYELYLVFYGNLVSDISCFNTILPPLSKVVRLNVNFDSTKITDLNQVKNAFTGLTSMVYLYFYFQYNKITELALQESFSTLEKLRHCEFVVSSPGGFESNFQNYYFANDYITTYRVGIMKGSFDMTQPGKLFKYLPNVKSVQIYCRHNCYNYEEFKFVVHQIQDLPLFENLYIYFYYQLQTYDPIDLSKWGDLLDPIRNQIKYFYILYYQFRYSLDPQYWTNILRDTPNLYKLYFSHQYDYENNKPAVARIDHPNISVLYYQFSRTERIVEVWDQFADIYAGFPKLNRNEFTCSYCSLTNENMVGFHNIYKSMVGHSLGDVFYLNLHKNSITDVNILKNPHGVIDFNNYIYFQLQYNQISNLDNLGDVLRSLGNADWKKFYMYLEYNILTDITGLATAFDTYLMEAICCSSNEFTNQKALNEVFFPVTYYGKSKVNEYQFQLKDLEYPVTKHHGGLKTEGYYPVFDDNGYCFSTFNQAKYYYETTQVIDEVESQKKNCGDCISTKCHSCINNITCEKCRYSVPARVLSTQCQCPDKYYDGDNYACLDCLRVCATCNNGDNCLTCITSNPVRITNLCICPNQYYDNGTNPQCQECINGCNTCINGSVCQECLPGFYKNGSSICIICPNKYETCSSATVGTKCQGNNRTTVTPDCVCQNGYFDDGTNKADCTICNSPCKYCVDTADKCLSCVDGYYLNGNNCIQCPDKYAKCSNPTTGLECQGTNRTSNLPNCECNPGYYDDNINSNCNICINNCDLCTSASICQACDAGYYLDNTTCPQCPNKYETCSSSTVGTKCQGNNRTTVTPDCICQNGYFDDGTNKADCTICNSPCKYCVDTADKCLSCVDGYYLNGNNCIQCPDKYAKCSNPTTGLECQGTNRTSNLPNCECNPGYYDDNINANCNICINNCDLCTSASICQACDAGYYLDNTTCPQCPNKYETCSSATVGTKCQGNNRTSVTPDCVCQNGYFDDGTNKADCTICNSPCKYCVDTADKCLSCVDGYYLNGNNCIQCPDKYAKCSNPTTGLECQGTNRTSNLPNCECNPGYYDDNINANCNICINNCDLCTSASICQACDAGYYLDNTTCPQCPNKYETCSSATVGTKCQGNNRTSVTPDCICQNGYFDDGTNKADCTICNSPCKYCVDTADKCLSCVDGYYLNGNNCIQCPDKYAKCSNPTTGLECQGTNRTSNLPNCECNPGYYDDNANANCNICINNCDLCTSASVCQACDAGYYLDNTTCPQCPNKYETCSSATVGTKCQGNNRTTVTPDCICQNGYFDDGTNKADCTICNSPCKYCVDTADKCLSCVDGYYLNGNNCIQCPNKYAKCSNPTTGLECQGNNRSSDLPNCECNPGYYDDNINSNCVICEYPCQNCTINKCLSCTDSINRNSDDSCTCHSNFYDNTSNQACESCHYKCQECSLFDTCDSCSHSTRDETLNCICKDNFYNIENQQQCEACKSPCLNCTNDTVCLDCLYIGRQFRNGTPTCTCQDVYYEDQITKDCLKCSEKCSKCSDFDTCLECNSELGDERNHDINDNCGCNPGFYDDNTNSLQCKVCQYPCKNCISDTQCIAGQCANQQYRDLESLICDCQHGFFDNGQKCEKCDLKCSQCQGASNICTGLICAGGDTRTNYPQCNCKDGLKEIGQDKCGVCANKCQECLGEIDNCTKCVVGNGRLQLNNNCACRESYYDDGINSDCQQCNSQCKTCSNSNSCDSCFSSNLNPDELCQKQLEQQTNASLAVINPVTNQLEIKQCDIQCQECENTLNFCKICTVGINRQNNLPHCTCQNGYHDQNNTKQDCLDLCDSSCLACNNFNSCTSCKEQENWVMDLTDMMCKCRNGFQEQLTNNYQKQCIRCNFTYNGICVQVCPEFTLEDQAQKICVDINYQFTSNILNFIVLGGIVILIKIFIFALLKKTFQNLIKNKFSKIKYSENLQQKSSIDNENSNSKSNSDQDNTSIPIKDIDNENQSQVINDKSENIEIQQQEDENNNIIDDEKIIPKKKKLKRKKQQK